jgi:hypothetical protein
MDQEGRLDRHAGMHDTPQNINPAFERSPEKSRNEGQKRPKPNAAPFAPPNVVTYQGSDQAGEHAKSDEVDTRFRDHQPHGKEQGESLGGLTKLVDAHCPGHLFPRLHVRRGIAQAVKHRVVNKEQNT